MNEQERVMELQEKAVPIAEDMEFWERLRQLEKPEDVQAAFKEKDVELSIDEAKQLVQTIEQGFDPGKMVEFNRRMEENSQKLEELMQDSEFVRSTLMMSEPEEVQAAFAERGVDFTIDDIKLLGKILERFLESDGELTEEDLEEVAGGWLPLLMIPGMKVVLGAGAFAFGGSMILTFYEEIGDFFRNDVRDFFRNDVRRAFRRVGDWFRTW